MNTTVSSSRAFVSMLTFFCFLLISIQGQAQHTEIKADARLFEAFSKEYVDQLQSNPRLLLYYNFFLENSYFLTDEKGKPMQGADIREVEMKEEYTDGQKRYYALDPAAFDTRTFNPLLYDFNIKADTYTTYLLGSTGKALVFLPHAEFARRYKAYLESFSLNTESK